MIFQVKYVLRYILLGHVKLIVFSINTGIQKSLVHLSVLFYFSAFVYFVVF